MFDNQIRHANQQNSFRLGHRAPHWRSGLTHCVSVHRGVTAVTGLNPESHRVAQCRPGLAVIVNKNLFITDLAG